MKRNYCCDRMKYFCEYKCDIHKNPFDCPDCIIFSPEKEHIYGIIIHDGGESFIKIDYCPWCGKRLS